MLADKQLARINDELTLLVNTSQVRLLQRLYEEGIIDDLEINEIDSTVDISD